MAREICSFPIEGTRNDILEKLPGCLAEINFDDLINIQFQKKSSLKYLAIVSYWGKEIL